MLDVDKITLLNKSFGLIFISSKRLKLVSSKSTSLYNYILPNIKRLDDIDIKPNDLFNKVILSTSNIK